MKRIIALALSVVLALVMAAPIASGKSVTKEDTNQSNIEPTQPSEKSVTESTTLDEAELTQKWWDWAMQDPSPMDGSYRGGEKCDGRFVDGAFFLSGQANSTVAKVNRTCTVPANTPILVPVVNIICSEAWPTDPTPYDQCATSYTDQLVDPPSTTYAKVDGKDVDQERIASGLFSWTIESDNNPFGLQAGTYEAGSDGLWVLLENGLKRGVHTVKVGGTYKDTPFGDFEGTKVNYTLLTK